MKRLIALILCLCSAFTPVQAEDTLLYMINVGKGDAIIVMAEGKNYLIDTGKSNAWENIESVLNEFGIEQLDGVFMTHTDKDHSGGLKKLAKSDVTVLAWYAAALCPENREDNPISAAAKKANGIVTWLSAGDIVDGLFTVLGPIRANYDKEDNNSLVLMLETQNGRVLLTGDMEFAEEGEIIASGADLSCDVFKVPNHADNDVCLMGIIDATKAKYALISTDPYDKPGTPDAFLMSRLENAGMEIYRTDYTEKGILVTMSETGITVCEN